MGVDGWVRGLFKGWMEGSDERTGADDDGWDGEWWWLIGDWLLWLIWG